MLLTITISAHKISLTFFFPEIPFVCVFETAIPAKRKQPRDKKNIPNSLMASFFLLTTTARCALNINHQPIIRIIHRPGGSISKRLAQPSDVAPRRTLVASYRQESLPSFPSSPSRLLVVLMVVVQTAPQVFVQHRSGVRGGPAPVVQ